MNFDSIGRLGTEVPLEALTVDLECPLIWMCDLHGPVGERLRDFIRSKPSSLKFSEKQSTAGVVEQHLISLLEFFDTLKLCVMSALHPLFV